MEEITLRNIMNQRGLAVIGEAITAEEKATEKVLTKCRGRNAREVLTNAAKLNSKERLLLIKYFDIEPQKLADTIVFFCLHAHKGIATSRGENPNIMCSE